LKGGRTRKRRKKRHEADTKKIMVLRWKFGIKGEDGLTWKGGGESSVRGSQGKKKKRKNSLDADQRRKEFEDVAAKEGKGG